MHALAALDETGTALEGAVGGERKPIGLKLGLIEPCWRGSIERRHGVKRSQQRTFARRVQVEFGEIGPRVGKIRSGRLHLIVK
jgi:hypothetical protein